MKVNARWLAAAWIGIVVADIQFASGRPDAAEWLGRAIIKDTFAYVAGALSLWLSIKEPSHD